MCTKESKFKLSNSKLTRRTPLIFDFDFGRLLTESKRIAATYRRDQEACEDEVRPCQPHATPGSSSCPDGGGDLALTLRRSVQELCVRCATQVTPRAFFFICETELRYALRSKARSVQSDMRHTCTSRLRRPCPIPRLPLQKRGRSCMPLAYPSLFHQYRCATVKLQCARKNPNSNWTTETHASAHFEFYFGRLLTKSKRIAATCRCDQEACEDEVLACQPHGSPGPSSCPYTTGGISV